MLGRTEGVLGATAAEEVLRRIGNGLPADSRKALERIAGASPDPRRVLHHLERLRDQHPESFTEIALLPWGLQALVAVFSYSEFLAEEVLQHPEWLRDLLSSRALEQSFSGETFETLLEECLDREGCPGEEPSALMLAQFRRRQLLRIMLRDVLGLARLPEVSEELSRLADAILEITCRRMRARLEARYGVPLMAGEDGATRPCGFTVISLGKLGGLELNYSSDIDLMFVYGGPGQSGGPRPISNKEFFFKLASRYTELLSTHTAEGLCYRVDLRLRPDGRLGEVCISRDAARQYYQQRGRDWELQMLIKARVSAGDRELGRDLLSFVEPLIYCSSLDFSAVEVVADSRHRIREKLAGKRGSSGLDVKLARGGIRDVEFLVQCLQRLHGGRDPWLRHGGTLLALSRAHDKGYLSAAEYSALAASYSFLRALEHRLQLEEDLQTHTLPKQPDQLETLARKMPVPPDGQTLTASGLLQTLNQHLEEVHAIYERIIHAQQPMYYTTVTAPAADTVAAEPDDETRPEPAATNLVRFLDQTAPQLGAALARKPLVRGRRHFEHFLERIHDHREYLKWLDSDRALAAWAFDLFEHSQYFGEQLIRRPELTEELLALHRYNPDAAPDYREIVRPFETPAELRRYFVREMFALQCRSICLREPVFATLGQASNLADAAIECAYRMSIEQVLKTSGPSSRSYVPESQMLVIALGRLGMREFDLASDADLVFVLPDPDAAEQLFWTRVAEKMVALLNAYTGDGVMFQVDTRLRPNGREGALVQLESSCKDYLAKRAEAWESISYMKSRGVAGNLEHAKRFLTVLQEIDWRRYGQSTRSRKLLAQMRMRVEREQGPSNPLKAGYGGYYDIDFALMYLRLKGGGIFFEVLNTPARIDVIEKMGHLDRSDAAFLLDAATFYRAVDHALRVYSGHTAGDLPKAPGVLRILSGLVERWTPEHRHDEPLDFELSQIRERTREFFNRVFG